MITMPSRENESTMHRPVEPVFTEGAEDEPENKARHNGTIGEHGMAYFVLPANYNRTESRARGRLYRKRLNL